MDEELRTYLDSKFGNADLRFTELAGKLQVTRTEMDARFIDMEARLTEKMRDMQTELPCGFESFSTGKTIRLRKLEADQSNLDVSLRGRVDVLESRLMQIELRLKIN